VMDGCRNKKPNRPALAPLPSEMPQPYIDPDFDKAGNRRYWEQRQAPLVKEPGRTCATCNAVLADGPQPLAIYEKQSSQVPGVDQIARVIQQHGQPDDPFDELDEEGRESHRKVARAILALIRAARVKELVSG
jgi:hypothetical protein